MSSLGITRVRLSADERRETILAAAKRVFAEAGYHEATTRDIAAAAGVSEALLYQHFPGKRQLFEDLIRDGAAELERRLQTATAGTEPELAQMGAFFDFVEEESEVFRVLFRQALQADPGFRALYLDRALHLARVPDDPPLSDATAHALTGMLSELALWWLEGAALTKAEMVERASRMARAICSLETEDGTDEPN